MKSYYDQVLKKYAWKIIRLYISIRSIFTINTRTVGHFGNKA